MNTMTLKLPQTYVEVEKEEMQYVEGGISWSEAKAYVIGAIGTAIGAMVGHAVRNSLVTVAISMCASYITAAINATILAFMMNPVAGTAIGAATIMVISFKDKKNFRSVLFH